MSPQGFLDFGYGCVPRFILCKFLDADQQNEHRRRSSNFGSAPSHYRNANENPKNWNRDWDETLQTEKIENREAENFMHSVTETFLEYSLRLPS
jgi:hypothetical protein